MQVTITINGEAVSRDIEPRQLLVHFIRETPGLTGTHWGCDTSNCGACVVLIDGEPVKSCTTLAVMCEGHEVSPDGLAWTFRLRPGLKWHDNQPVLARDCTASLERWMVRDNMGQMVKARLAEIAPLDDRSFRLRLTKPVWE